MSGAHGRTIPQPASYIKLRNYLRFDVSLPPAKYASPVRTQAFFDALVDRLRARAVVEAAGAAEYPPLAGADSATPFYVDGRPRPAPGESVRAHDRSVTPGYFAAIGIRIAAGRALTDRDGGEAPRVAVINETMARRHFPNLMSGLLFGVAPADPIAIAGASALVVTVAFAACYVPARRAMRVDPIVALRRDS